MINLDSNSDSTATATKTNGELASGTDRCSSAQIPSLKSTPISSIQTLGLPVPTLKEPLMLSTSHHLWLLPTQLFILSLKPLPGPTDWSAISSPLPTPHSAPKQSMFCSSGQAELYPCPAWSPTWVGWMGRSILDKPRRCVHVPCRKTVTHHHGKRKIKYEGSN